MPQPTDPLRSELRIAAPPEIVFPYFTDPARMTDWMGVAALLDPRPGGIFRVEPNARDVVVGETAGEMAICGYTWAMIIDRLGNHVARGERAPYFTADAPLPN